MAAIVVERSRIDRMSTERRQPNSILLQGTQHGVSKITVTLYTCERCEHKWIPREAIAGTEALPTVCPKCKSPYWNRPRQNEPPSKPAAKSKRAKKSG